MEVQNQEEQIPTPTPHFGERLYCLAVTFKVWIVIYGTFLILIDMFNSTYPKTLLIVPILYFTMNYFKISPSPNQNVVKFFGSSLRPSLEEMEHSNPNSNHQKQSSSCLSVIAHRGAGLDAPENSLSAFRLSKTKGALAVEFDLSLTKDNIAVLFHDDNLMRIAGIDREIKEMTYQELQAIDISIKHPLHDRFRGERIPTFEEAIQTCLSLDLKFFIDLKDDDEKMAEQVLGAFKKYPTMYYMAVITGFNPLIVYKIRRRDPKIIGCMATRPNYWRFRTWNSNWENLEKRYTFFVYDWAAIILDQITEWAIRNVFWWFIGLSAYLYQKDSITKEATYRWTKKGMRIVFWTSNPPIEKAYFTQCVQIGYMTDTLDGDPFYSVTANSILQKSSPPRFFENTGYFNAGNAFQTPPESNTDF